MKTERIPFARIAELKNRTDANLLLIKPSVRMFDDWSVIRFPTRHSLEAFNVRAGLKPVVFTQVPLNCAVHRHQSDSEAREGKA